MSDPTPGMASLLLVAYFAALAMLSIVGLHRLVMAVVAARSPTEPDAPDPERWPSVLVQLPIYNEALVAERLLRHVAALEYPGQLRIQVLDDSTDHTRALVDRVAEEIASDGVSIDVVRRQDRRGYKAGALAHGLTLDDAECVAIFDADFLPPSDFLRRTIPSLVASPEVGLVQARWGHINRDASWLTRAQAVFLDGHFAVEHAARATLGHFFNFNGTAGVWRRAAIDAAGGWRDLTITEDLDLSYRAQLAGWRFVYLDDVVTPAELPESWVAFRAQQARWVRGSVETARLLLRDVIGSRLPVGLRIDALVHLGQNFAYVGMAALATLLPAAVVLRDQLGWRVPGGQTVLSVLDLTMLGAGTGAMLAFYGVGAWRSAHGPGWRRGLEVLFALCVGAGMSLTNTAEVLAGLRSRRSEFVRTPKQGAASRRKAATVYRSPIRLGRLLVEVVYLVYFGVSVGYAVTYGLVGALPFLVMYTVGFAAVSLHSTREVLGPLVTQVATAARSQA